MRTAVKIINLVIICAFMSSCGQSGQKTGQPESGTISISGAFALYPMTVKWAEEYQKEHPGIRIDISAGGAGKGMTDALNQMVDMGMFSREVSPEETAKGAWKVAVVKDAVVCTINAGNPALPEIQKKGLTKTGFRKLFLNENFHNWSEIFPGLQSEIHVYTRSDACGAAEIWAKYLGGNQESLKGIGVFGDPGMANAIKMDVQGIGYNNVGYTFDATSRKKLTGMEIIPIDINEDGVISPDENIYETLDQVMAGIAEGKYPSPPARPLYLIAKGKPQKPEVLKFLEWILTKGQDFVAEAGYVQLSQELIKDELNRLKRDS